MNESLEGSPKGQATKLGATYTFDAIIFFHFAVLSSKATKTLMHILVAENIDKTKHIIKYF
jgi:hypothetical protein